MLAAAMVGHSLAGELPVTLPETFARWKSANFSEQELSDGTSDDLVSVASDGLSNLLKYAFGLDAHTLTLESGLSTILDDGHLAITFRSNPFATDINYAVEVTNDLSTWNSGDTYTEIVNQQQNEDASVTITVRDKTSSADVAKRFMRLSVTRTTLDTDGDHLPDDWELKHFHHTYFSGTDDADDDLVSNEDEFIAGTDPYDSFNGTVPTLEIVAGDLQEAYPNTVLGEPLSIRLHGPAGAPLANLPISYYRTDGNGEFLASNSPQDVIHQNPIPLRTDANGNAKLWFLAPPIVNSPTHITVTAGAGGKFAQVEFALRTQDLPAPVPPTELVLGTDTQGHDVLTWVDNSDDEDSFVVQQQQPDGSWLTVAYLPPNSTTYTVPQP